MKFRKKPVVVDAFRWDGSEAVFQQVSLLNSEERDLTWQVDKGTLTIETLEGKMTADVGDWIIRGVKGELYPCKHEIFVSTYDPVPLER